MPTPPLTAEQLREAVETVAHIAGQPGYAYRDRSGGKSAIEQAADVLGINASTLNHRLHQAEQRFGWTVENYGAPEPPSPEELEDLPDGLSVIRRHQQANNEYVKKVAGNKRRIIPVRPEPFAIAFVGDPHLDNKGSDLAALERDLNLIRASKMRAVGMGDVVDNFQALGKLASKQANNHMSVKEGLAAARWFIRDCRVKWDAQLLGNHDMWGEEPYSQLVQEWARDAKARFYPWAVTLSYQWDGGAFTVFAAHDMKGHSQYNKLHGLMKRALVDGEADLYVAAHRHEAADGSEENGYRGKRYNYLRVKGYKRADEYAWVKQFPEQTEGASGVAVVNPRSETMKGRCQIFYSIPEAAEMLKMLRSHYA